MPKTTEQVTDHKAEALRLLEWIGNPIETGGGDDPRSADVLAVATIHSNLAIAEGQERVAKETKQLRLCLDEVIDPAADPAHPAVLRVRTEEAEP